VWKQKCSPHLRYVYDLTPKIPLVNLNVVCLIQKNLQELFLYFYQQEKMFELSFQK